MSDTKDLLIAALRAIGYAVWIYTNNTKGEAIDPTENNGSEFINDTFEMRAFDWSEPEVYAPNFKYKDFEVEWYKYLGRGTEVNRPITPDEINEMLKDCLNSLEEENVLRQAVDMSGNEFAMGYNDSGCFWSFYAGQRGAGAMIGDPVFTSESPDPIEALKEYIAKQRDQLSNRSSDEKRRTTKPNEEQPNE